jgi:hypothetical protein
MIDVKRRNTTKGASSMARHSETPDEYSEAETARRRDAIVRNMIATPPRPHTGKPQKRKPSRAKAAIRKPRKTA